MSFLSQEGHSAACNLFLSSALAERLLKPCTFMPFFSRLLTLNWLRRKKSPPPSSASLPAVPSPLFEVYYGSGDLEELQRLIEQGEPVSESEIAGIQPIHCAARHGYLDIMKYLFHHGASITAGRWKATKVCLCAA